MNDEAGLRIRISTIIATVGILLAAGLPVAAQEQSFFSADGGSAACALSVDSPTPGPVPLLTIADGTSLAGIAYGCPGCTGAAPAVPPSFYFKSSVASGSAGASPGLVIAFDDFSFVQLRPLEWSGDWQLVDGAGDNWDSAGGTCGFLEGVSYETALGCHAGQSVITTFVWTAAGSVTAPYAHWIDDVKIGATTFTGCSLTAVRHVRRPADIDVGPDLGETGHMALNFSGRTGAAGDTWVTLYDATPGDATRTIFIGSVGASADVLTGTFNNKKGAGVLALYNEGTGEGLALTLYDAGNSDSLVLSAVNRAGKLTPLKTVRLGAAITENVWYRVTMDVAISGSSVSVTGRAFRHATPASPHSELDGQVGGLLTFSGTLGTGELSGVGDSGEVGVLAAAVSAVVNSSVTNFEIDPDGEAGSGSGPTEIVFD